MKPWKRAASVTVVFSLLLLLSGLPDAFGIYSENYRIDNSSVVGGGGEASGIQYKMEAGVAGQRGFGTYSTASYKLEAGFLPATSGTGVPIESNILTPAIGEKVYGAGYQITGSAASPDGIAFVEVSTDGGKTWGTASGTGSWSFDWTLPAPGLYNIRSRATDSHNNVETPSAGINLDVVQAFQLNLSANPANGGVAAANPAAVIYPSGQKVRLTATANLGYLFNGWAGAVTEPNTNPTDITMDSDREVEADFVARNGMDLAFTQMAKTVTLNAAGFDKGTPLAGKTFKFYKSTYSPTTSAWSAWALLGTATAGINSSATKICSMSNGTYQFKATYEPTGAPKVESVASGTCVIGPVMAISPATGTVTSDSTPPAAWNAFPGATGYVFQTCPSSKFTTGVTESTNLGNVTTGDLPALPRGVKAYWRVVALLPAGRSIPSAARYIIYKEGTSFATLDAGKSGMTIRPSATLNGNASGPLAGKTVYFSYRKTGTATWISAGYSKTDSGGVARVGAQKTLTAGNYDLKATFKGDAGYYLCNATGSFTLP